MKKVALITGASSGIGREFARIHAARGGDLILVARSMDRLKALQLELKAIYGVEVVIIPRDLTERDAAWEIYSLISRETIKVDYLINNAGFGGHGKFHERKWETDLAMINLNVVALTALTRFFLMDFVRRNEGKILNVSSTASLLPGPLQAVYYATKAYVTFFSNAVAEELRDTNITVTTLLPGATKTGFAKASGMDRTNLFAKTADPYSVAEDGYNGMLQGKLDVVSGLTTSQKFMMNMIPLTPKKMLLRQVRQMQEIAS